MSPAKKTDLSPLEIPHEDHSVLHLSIPRRPDWCWLGRQLILAEIGEEIVFGSEDEASLIGLSNKSRSSHQSNSVTFSGFIEQLRNHFLLPLGTKKWALGCLFAISVTVGYERWS